MLETYEAALKELDAEPLAHEDASEELDNEDFGPFPEIADDPPPGPGN